MEPVKVEETLGKILCCQCPTLIDPNPTNQCLQCMKNAHDPTEPIPKSGMLQFCSGCERYLEPPSSWVSASLESKELLKICLKKLRLPSSLRLIDAKFLWTEPHSKRIHVKVVIQKEVVLGAVLEQEFVSEYHVQHLMCNDCHRVQAKDCWNAMVQVRQKTTHKRTFYYLEQLILKHRMHEKAVGIKPMKDGINFAFSHQQHAFHLVEFLRSVTPCRWNESKKLKSHDIHSNTYNYKYTYSVEIVPICRGSIVCLPIELSQKLGKINQLCIVNSVTSNVMLIDPITAQIAELSGEQFWKTPFNEIVTAKKLTEFVVMDLEEVAPVQRFKGQGRISSKHKVGFVFVQRPNDIGRGEPVWCKSHIYHLLAIGDSVLGYCLETSNINNNELNSMKEDDIPNVILVRKLYGSKSYRNKRRQWKLQHMVIDDDQNSENEDYMDFLEELEEDSLVRTNINIFRNPSRKNFSPNKALEEEGLPTIGVDEMLNDLVNDVELDDLLSKVKLIEDPPITNDEAEDKSQENKVIEHTEIESTVTEDDTEQK